MNNREFYISLDTKYLFIENKVINLFEDRLISEEEQGLSFWLNMLKENTVLAAKTNKIEHYNINKLVKDVAYGISERITKLNNVDFIYEFERRFGTPLILESTNLDKYVSKLEKSWDFILDKIHNYSLIYEEANDANSTSTFKNKIGPIIELFREKALYSLVGGIVQAGISIYAPGVGSAAISSVWGAMLFYDLYLMSIGETNWANIIFDILGIIPGLGSVLGKTAKTVKSLVSNTSKADDVVAIIAKTSPKLSNALSGVSKFASKAINAIKQGASWLAQKTKLTWIKTLISKVVGLINNVFDTLGALAAPKTGKAAQIFTAKANSAVAKTAASDYLVTKADEKYGVISKPIGKIMDKFSKPNDGFIYDDLTPDEGALLNNLLKKYENE